MSATFVIAQGGGPTAVINQTLAGAVLRLGVRGADAFPPEAFSALGTAS